MHARLPALAFALGSTAALVLAGALPKRAVAASAPDAGRVRAPDAGDTAAASDVARRSAVVAKVGTHAITVGDLEDRLAEIPPFQLAGFGATPAAAARKVLEEALIPDELLVSGADVKNLGGTLPTSQRVLRAQSSATLRAVRTKVGPAASIPLADVARYYDENRARYEQPERYGVWRILCKTRDEATKVLEAAKKDATPATFLALAREHSIDKATNLRGGNLGFLTLDGASNEAGLRVDAAIVKAATTVRDGELVSAPIEEGDAFAVVWRRGTVPAAKRTVDEAAAQIRDTLFKQRVEKANRDLLSELRTRNVRELNDALIETIEIAPENGSVVPKKRPAGDAGIK